MRFRRHFLEQKLFRPCPVLFFCSLQFCIAVFQGGIQLIHGLSHILSVSFLWRRQQGGSGFSQIHLRHIDFSTALEVTVLQFVSFNVQSHQFSIANIGVVLCAFFHFFLKFFRQIFYTEFFTGFSLFRCEFFLTFIRFQSVCIGKLFNHLLILA